MARTTDERFTSFVRDDSGRLLRLAYLLTQDHGHAEDVVQGALLKTHRRWGRLRDPDRAYAYAKQVVVTTAASRRRLRSNQEVVDLPDHVEASTPADSESFGDREAMRDLLRRLPPRTRTVLVLRYWADMSEADTAAALGCSVHTVRSQANRGLHRLRAHLTTSDTPSPTGRGL